MDKTDNFKMKVSILIPLYNSEKYIEETILSALNQTWQNKEVIIVDDGSTDNSYLKAKSFESEIVSVYKQDNTGAPGARNLAFRESTGDYIQYLDADDLMSPNKIESQMNLLANYSYDKDIVASSGWVGFNDEDDIDTLVKRNICNKNYDPSYEALIDYWKCSFPSMPYHNYLTHRDQIAFTGNWNEDLKKNQDCEFFARIIQNCRKLVYSDSAIVYYRDVINSISKATTIEKIYSELLTSKIITEIILSNTKSKDALYACSLHYTEFIVSRYPLNKIYLKEAYSDMKKYGLKFIVSNRGYSYRILYFLFGWKITKRILIPYNRLKSKINK